MYSGLFLIKTYITNKSWIPDIIIVNIAKTKILGYKKKEKTITEKFSKAKAKSI